MKQEAKHFGWEKLISIGSLLMERNFQSTPNRLPTKNHGGGDWEWLLMVICFRFFFFPDVCVLHSFRRVPLYNTWRNEEKHRCWQLYRVGRVLRKYVWNKVCVGYITYWGVQSLKPFLFPCSKQAVQDVQVTGKCCVLDIDMQVQCSLIPIPEMAWVWD